MDKVSIMWLRRCHLRHRRNRDPTVGVCVVLLAISSLLGGRFMRESGASAGWVREATDAATLVLGVACVGMCALTGVLSR